MRRCVIRDVSPAAERGADDLEGFTGLCCENGSSKGHNLALTGLFFPKLARQQTALGHSTPGAASSRWRLSPKQTTLPSEKGTT